MKRFLISILIVLIFPIFAYASGIIAIPPMPNLGIDKTYLSVESYNANIKVSENITHVSIDEIFVNPYNKQVEGTFLFPLPQGASVNKFSMVIGGKLIQGKIFEKNEARRMYEKIVRLLVDPALLEYVGRNTYRASIAPIAPNGKIKVHIEFIYTLPRTGNSYYITCPLSGLKYSKDPVKSIVITGNIEGSKDIVNLYSPIYPLDSEIDGTEATFSLEKTNTNPDKDLLIYFSQDIKEVSGALLTYEKDSDEDGYFMFLISAAQRKKEAGMPKDIIVLLDKSGSMTGEKIKQAKEALTFIVKRMKKNDRVRVITFSSNVRILNPGWVLCSDKKGIQNLITQIKRIGASGGTNIYSALSQAFFLNMRKNAAHYVIFLTDGMPTVGIKDESKIEQLVGDKIRDKRLFVFGIGDDVNLEFLTKLFRKGRGQGEFILGKDIETAISAFYAKIEDPMLSNIQITYPEIFYEIYPKDVQDLFWAQNLILLGRYEKGKTDNIKLILKGDTTNGPSSYFFQSDISPNSINNFIPYLWASRKIGYLLEEIRLNGETKELVNSVIALSKKYGVITPYTSYLVNEEQGGVQPAPMVKYSAAPMSAKRKTVKKEQLLQNAQIVAENKNINGVETKHIGNRIFAKKDIYWIETGYKENISLTEIKMFSDEYFKLARENEELRKILALGKVIFKYKGKWIKIIK